MTGMILVKTHSNSQEKVKVEQWACSYGKLDAKEVANSHTLCVRCRMYGNGGAHPFSLDFACEKQNAHKRHRWLQNVGNEGSRTRTNLLTLFSDSDPFFPCQVNPSEEVSPRKNVFSYFDLFPLLFSSRTFFIFISSLLATRHTQSARRHEPQLSPSSIFFVSSPSLSWLQRLLPLPHSNNCLNPSSRPTG